MNNRKKLQDLTIRDNFMFAAVMMQDDNCQHFLEMVLGIEIERVVVSYEKSIIYNPDYKGIRLDVYARDEFNTCYDVEMQVEKDNLGKRTRYYHSHMDMELLESGERYETLPGSYVIFVCDFDPFDRKKYCYTFENRCLEDLDLGLKDGSRSIFLSTKGKNGDKVPIGLKAFLDFVDKDTESNDMESEDAYVKQIQKTIRSIKESREMEHRFQGAWATSEYNRGKVEGKLQAKRDAVLELLEEYGNIPQSVHERVWAESDVDVLKRMHKAAAKSDSIEQFEEKIANL